MNRKLGIIIQARTGSTRLPGKVLMTISGDPLILNLYNRLNNYFDLPIIIATTDSHNDDRLAELFISRNIKIYRGSEDNVLTRFIEAAQCFEVTDIIRICGDNLFIDLDFLDQLINRWKHDVASDYISFEFKKKPVILSHFGIFAEIIKLSALQKITNLFPDNTIFLEHVTNGIYQNPGIFKILLLNLDEELSDFEGIRLTIDTIDDFDRISKLMIKMKNVKFTEIANYILSQPEMFAAMKQTSREQTK